MGDESESELLVAASSRRFEYQLYSLVHLELAIGVVCNEIRQLSAALHASKSTAFPSATCDELECYTLVSIFAASGGRRMNKTYDVC